MNNIHLSAKVHISYLINQIYHIMSHFAEGEEITLSL